MKNQALVFGLLGAGGILLVKAVTGSSFSDILSGRAGAISSTGQNLLANASSNGVAGVGQSIANSTGQATAGLSGSVTQMVNQLSGQHGWSATEAQAWLNVINAESGGRLTAKNPTSSAYGIAQFINGPSEYYTYGGNPSTQSGQLTAMANYIKERYGTPSAAWAHEQTYHWY